MCQQMLHSIMHFVSCPLSDKNFSCLSAAVVDFPTLSISPSNDTRYSTHMCISGSRVMQALLTCPIEEDGPAIANQK